MMWTLADRRNKQPYRSVEFQLAKIPQSAGFTMALHSEQTYCTSRVTDNPGFYFYLSTTPELMMR